MTDTSATSDPEAAVPWDDWGGDLDEDWAHDDEDEFEGRRHKFNLRKIVAFELDQELYGADIADVAEMMPMQSIMPLPNVEEHVLGLINLRGSIVPVIDLRIIFGLTCNPLGLESRIIIMCANELLVGMLADRMWELLRLPPDAFQPPPADASKAQAEFFKEVGQINDRMLVVLDIKKILAKTARSK